MHWSKPLASVFKINAETPTGRDCQAWVCVLKASQSCIQCKTSCKDMLLMAFTQQEEVLLVNPDLEGC